MIHRISTLRTIDERVDSVPKDLESQRSETAKLADKEARFQAVQGELRTLSPRKHPVRVSELMIELRQLRRYLAAADAIRHMDFVHTD